MGTGADVALHVRRRVGVGVVELVPEPAVVRSLGAVRENLTNRISLLLVAVIVAAQVADVITTVRALSSSLYMENNPLLRALIVRSPLAAYSVKLLAVTALVLVILSRLRGPRARVALTVAAGLSLLAPVLNFSLLMHL